MSSDYLGHLEFGSLASASPYRLQSFVLGDDGVTVDVAVEVEGTSADNLATRVEALIAEVAQPGNVYVHFQQGATNPLAYRVLSSTNPMPEDLTTWCGFQQVLSWRMTVDAWPDGAFTTLYSAEAVNAPASLSLATLLGTYGSPADVTVDDASGNDMHSVHVHLALEALKDTMWRVYASALTWTTMTNVGATANAWSNDPRSTTSASWQTAALDTSQYPAGAYRVWYRVAQSAGTGYVMDSQNLTETAVTQATYHLIDGGEVHLPVADTAFGTASNLTFYCRSDGTNTFALDAILLLPLDLGYFSYHPDNPLTEIDQIDFGPSGCWQDGTADATSLKSSGPLTPTVLAAHCPELIATASPSGSTWPTDWGRTDSGVHVTADTSRIKVVAASHYAWYAATVLGTPIVTPGKWYRFGITYDVDSYFAGAGTVEAVWLDIDGNTVRADMLLSLTANSASTATTLYAKAPYNARRCYLRVGQSAAGNLTVYFSAASMKQCPLRLIVVAEDAAGALSSNTHAVAVTYKYPARYGVAR